MSARARRAAGDIAGARTVIERGLSRAVDVYGEALLKVELAELLAADEPRRARAHAREAAALLAPLGAAPLLERVRVLAETRAGDSST